MGKTRRGDKELSRERRLTFENRKLRKEISSLRKQLARVDLDRFNNVKEMIEDAYQEDKQEGQDILENLKKAWKCHKCPNGYLEIITYNKLDKTWYFRRCSSFPACGHRTESQEYDPKVAGIMNKNNKLPED